MPNVADGTGAMQFECPFEIVSLALLSFVLFVSMLLFVVVVCVCLVNVVFGVWELSTFKIRSKI